MGMPMGGLGKPRVAGALALATALAFGGAGAAQGTKATKDVAPQAKDLPEGAEEFTLETEDGIWISTTYWKAPVPKDAKPRIAPEQGCVILCNQRDRTQPMFLLDGAAHGWALRRIPSNRSTSGFGLTSSAIFEPSLGGAGVDVALGAACCPAGALISVDRGSVGSSVR